MLTIYHKQSSFKKKFSVVVIWIVAIYILFIGQFFNKYRDFNRSSPCTLHYRLGSHCSDFIT